MGLHRVIRRYRRLGVRATADYVRRRMSNSLVQIVNRIGPARYACPCCGWYGTRFLDFTGHGYGNANYVCPGCGSHPRHRGLFLFLGKLVAELPPRAVVLHLAPEQAVARAFSARHDLTYVTGDLTMRSVAARLDLNSMPFKDGTFELLLSSHMLEHLPGDERALHEISRVVASGGTALILVPTFPDWEFRPTLEFGAPNPQFDDHYRIYGSDVINRIAAAGFECKPIRFSSFLSAQQLRFHRIDDETIFVARKG